MTKLKDSLNECSMKTIWLRILPLLIVLAALIADHELVRAQSLTPQDKIAIRDVVQAQLNAFKADDAALAYSYASPAIQAKAGSSSAFMAMVRTAYKPVYRPRAVFFQNITVMNGVPAQRVLIMDHKGTPVLAVYPMEQQADGSWRINGCMLYKGDAQML